jgi:hypothetical protein
MFSVRISAWSPSILMEVFRIFLYSVQITGYLESGQDPFLSHTFQCSIHCLRIISFVQMELVKALLSKLQTNSSTTLVTWLQMANWEHFKLCGWVIINVLFRHLPIIVAARSKTRNVSARSNAGIVASNPTQGMSVCLCLFCVCVVLCRQRPCVGLIPCPRSPTD